MELRNFNYWIEAALEELRRVGHGSPVADRKWCLGLAEGYLTAALGLANKMQDSARRWLCFRVINWLRADLRRAS